MRFVKRTTRRKLACIKHITTCMLHAITISAGALKRWLLQDGKQGSDASAGRSLAIPRWETAVTGTLVSPRSSGKTLDSPENGKQAFFFVKIRFTFAT